MYPLISNNGIARDNAITNQLCSSTRGIPSIAAYSKFNIIISF